MKITGISQTEQSRSASSAQRAGSSGFSKVLGESLSASTDLDAVFKEASAAYGVPVNLLKAVAKAESGFNPNAKSGCGAMGVMQLMPATAKALGVTNAYDPRQNIMGGAKQLSRLLKSYNGDAALACAAYNAGSGAVAKYGGVPPYAETRAYVKKVLSYAGMDLTAGTVSGPLSSGTAQDLASGMAANAALSAAGSPSGLSSGTDSALLASLLSAAGGGDSGKAMQELMLNALLEMQMSDQSEDIFGS